VPVYLVRHGESEGNVRQLYQGRLDLPLTERGGMQARALGRWLRLMAIACAAVYSSPLKRAWRTAELVCAEAGLPAPVPEPLIQEYFVGELEGLSIEQIEERWPGFDDRPLASRGDFAQFGGESYAEMQARLSQFIAKVHGQHASEESILAVGHGGSLSQLLKLWCGYPAPRHFFARLGNCTCLKLSPLRLDGCNAAQLEWMAPVELMEQMLDGQAQGDSDLQLRS
jgi:broad specificity phosphatase PhoE